MFTITRPAIIEATAEAAMMNRPCLYTVALPGKAAETFKATAGTLAPAMELLAVLGYRLIDVQFPQGFGLDPVEAVAVQIVESVFPDAYGITETIITTEAV